MSATGETELSKILKTLKPVLNEGEYIFASVADDKFFQIERSKIIGMFREAEGVTVIVSRAYADSINLEFNFVAAWITLSVHSSLEATGLTAAFASALGNASISCNVIAAVYHDHIFVPFGKAEEALNTLNQLCHQAETDVNTDFSNYL